MSFENPQGLWLLALGIPILAFHFYKGRIRRMSVPMLLFWEQVIIEEERKSALKKLRYWASLLLNLTALFVLTSAVSSPSVKGLTRPKARFVVILDNTPSMAAGEPDGRSRAQAAVDRAREFVTTLAYGDRVAVHDLGGVRHAFTSDLSALAARMTVPAPAFHEDLRGRIQSALAAGDDVTAVLFTDRPPAGMDDLLSGGRLRVARIGAAAENAGWISGQQIRRPGEKGVTLSLRAAAFARDRVKREEVLTFNGKELQRRALELEPGVPVVREIRIDPARFPGEQIEEGGLAEVVLLPRDGLSLDDVASFVLPPLTPPSVFVVHPGKPSDLLMHALETLKSGGVIAQDLSVAASLPPRLAEGRIVIYDRVVPQPLPATGARMVIGAPGKDAVEKPTLADWDHAAPPNRQVDYAGMLLRRSRILSAGQPLIRAVEGPVATWDSRGGRAQVELGFSLEDSDIAARPTFLLLLLNFAEWASYAGQRAFRTQYAVGEPLRPERKVWVDEGELTLAQGDRITRSEIRDGLPASAPPAGPGFVRVSAAGRSEWAAANLFDPAESDLQEADPVPITVPPPPPAPWHARIPYAVLAVAVVLCLLLVEGWLFHRGLI